MQTDSDLISVVMHHCQYCKTETSNCFCSELVHEMSNLEVTFILKVINKLMWKNFSIAYFLHRFNLDESCFLPHIKSLFNHNIISSNNNQLSLTPHGRFVIVSLLSSTGDLLHD